jgi:hypothetical protein
MSNPMVQLQEGTIKAQCKLLRMPIMASQFSSVAAQAVREKETHIGYLEVLTRGGVGRARTEHHRATDQRRAFAQGQDAGGVRLHAVTECVGSQDARTRRGRVSRTRRALFAHPTVGTLPHRGIISFHEPTMNQTTDSSRPRVASGQSAVRCDRLTTKSISAQTGFCAGHRVGPRSVLVEGAHGRQSEGLRLLRGSRFSVASYS